MHEEFIIHAYQPKVLTTYLVMDEIGEATNCFENQEKYAYEIFHGSQWSQNMPIFNSV